MRPKYIFTIIILFNSLIFSQFKTEDYYKSVLISLKAGYHTGFDLSYERGFPDGLVYEGAIAVGVSKNILLGVNFDYWKRKNYEVKNIFTGEFLNKNYNSFGYRFYVQYRNTYLNKFDFYADAGLGRYKISIDYLYNNIAKNDHNYYLNIGLNIGAGYKLSKLLSVYSEISYYKLLDIDMGGSNIASIANIKLGTTFYFKIK